jgi:transcriptional regulator with XRE-family HTH domain
MPTKNQPLEVEQTLKRLGQNLRIARLRRKLTLQEVASKIGTGVRAIANAEQGKPSTGVAVYITLLWTYNLLNDFDVADPKSDQVGSELALSREPKRARVKGLDNDF